MLQYTEIDKGNGLDESRKHLRYAFHISSQESDESDGFQAEKSLNLFRSHLFEEFVRICRLVEEFCIANYAGTGIRTAEQLNSGMLFSAIPLGHGYRNCTAALYSMG
jgi:hypothetical protein